MCRELLFLSQLCHIDEIHVGEILIVAGHRPDEPVAGGAGTAVN
jgi:hypothetical protein